MSVSNVPAPPSPFPQHQHPDDREGYYSPPDAWHRPPACAVQSLQRSTYAVRTVHRRGGRCVPTLYAATSREAAAFESIFHDIEPSATVQDRAPQTSLNREA